MLFLLLSCTNQAQVINVDKIPIDTTKWSPTDTLYINLNDDSIQDLILVFDKYAAATRPSNIQTPILFFLGKDKNSYTFIGKGERLIFSPYYQFKISDRTFSIDQNGIGEDSKVYSNFYKYHNKSVVMFREIILQKVEKLKVDDNTGDVTSTIVRTDTLIKKDALIPVNEYNILDLVSSRK
jgi:hypothetical protein